jgi:hypothetical protein
VSFAKMPDISLLVQTLTIQGYALVALARPGSMAHLGGPFMKLGVSVKIR